MLGDLGADVIKIESAATGGDPSRAASPRYDGNGASESVYFCNVNRNKRSIALDLKAPGDRERLFALVRDAHVVVENFRTGTADRLGIGYAALKARNPAIVYCAVTGYGQEGPLAAMPGHDLNIAGMAGFLQFDANEVPRMPNVLMGDYAAANAAVIAILAALVAARTTGIGAFIDVSMIDALSSWSSIHLTGTFAAERSGAEGRVEGWGGNPRYGIYAARDGRYLTVSLLEKDLWSRFCRTFGRPDLVNEQETQADRLTSHGPRAQQYRTFIADVLARDDRDAWVRRFRELELPICAVYTPNEWVRSDVARERGLFPRVDVPQLGCSVPQVGFPFRMRMADGSPALAFRTPPPVLDEYDEAPAGMQAASR